MPEAGRARRRDNTILALILLLAAALRVLTIFECRTLGFFREPLSDARVYVERARGIAAGDWAGPGDFVHAPLYAYFVAAVGGPVDDYVWSPRVAQALVGVAGVALVYLATRRLFGPAAALIAAALLAVYPPAIFFDVIIQKASLTLALAALVIATAVWAGDSETARGRLLRWALAGVALGLLILNRQHALLYVPLLAVWASFPARKAVGRRAGPAVAMLIACAATLLPWAIRNRVVLGEWVLTTPNLGQNLAMGVGPHATGTYRPSQRGYATGEREQRAWTREAEKAAGRELSPREVSAYFFSAASRWISAHPAEWLAQTGRKIALTWAAYELPDTEDYYLYQAHAPALRWLDRGLHFGVLAPLAALGIALTLSAVRRVWPLYVWLVLTTLSVAAFVVFARYRLPLLPVLLAFAGAGLVEVVRCLCTRRFVPAAAALGTAALVAVAANGPLSQERAPRAFSHANHAVALADRRRYDEALAELTRALTLAPQSVDVHQLLGSVLLDVGRADESLSAFRRARDGDPNYAAAWRGMGDALVALGRDADALPLFQEAVRLDPDDAASRSGLGAALARGGQFDAALEHLLDAVHMAPRYAKAHLNLGNTYLAMGRLQDAEAAYARALEIEPTYVDAWFNRGVLEMYRQRAAAAAECFEAVLRERPGHAQAQQALIESLLAAGAVRTASIRLEAMLQADPGRPDLLELRARVERKGAAPRTP